MLMKELSDCSLKIKVPSLKKLIICIIFCIKVLLSICMFLAVEFTFIALCVTLLPGHIFANFKVLICPSFQLIFLIKMITASIIPRIHPPTHHEMPVWIHISGILIGIFLLKRSNETFPELQDLHIELWVTLVCLNNLDLWQCELGQLLRSVPWRSFTEHLIPSKYLLQQNKTYLLSVYPKYLLLLCTTIN